MKYLIIIIIIILNPQILHSEVKQNSPENEDYKLNNGDILDITIYGVVRAKRKVVIDSRGYITFLLTGAIKAEGKTIPQLRKELNDIVTQKRKHVVVSVVPVAFNSQSYTINGQIKFPGKKPLDGNTTLLQAIAISGGFQTGEFRNSTVDLADLAHAFIVRDNEKLNVDFHQLVLKGNTELDVKLKNGDYIFIPSALTQHIHILGRVKFPRKIIYLNSVTLIQALTEGRGRLEDASSYAAIIRGSLSEPEQILVNIDDILAGKAPDVLLKPNDIIYVPEDASQEFTDLGKTAIRAFVRTIASRAADNSAEFLIPERRIESDVK